MLGEIATAAGYVKAPKTRYVVRHPLKARRMARVRSEITPARVAMGIGALLAIPLGIWLGRRMIESRREASLESASQHV